jgi:ABC-type multidrug transport system ATPase subunit
VPGSPELICADVPEGVSTLDWDPARGRLSIDGHLDVSSPLRIIRRGEQVWVLNLDSRSGIRVNARPFVERQALVPGDWLTLPGLNLCFSVPYALADPRRNLGDLLPLIVRGEPEWPEVRGEHAAAVPLGMGARTLGSSGDCDVVLRDPLVSGQHARIERRQAEYVLSDLGSRTGTFLNGQAVLRTCLRPGDLLQIGAYLFRLNGSVLVWMRQPPAVTVAALGLSHAVGPLRLLDRVMLAVQPGELVGLLGPSGAGKTTLLNALCGLRPASAGQVHVNGESLYGAYDRLRHLIGYVPQEDIVHAELTCRQALTFAGRLRLPPMRSAELAARVGEILAAVGLEGRADVPISRLSGGQRKRVSVGIELLARPRILFLDEPTSGLDPATSSRLMRLFRRIAHQGCPVLCTTHVMEDVKLFDQVAVLVPGGRLAYFGRPARAKAYFGIRKFTEVYDRLEERTPADWQQRFERTPEHGRLRETVAAERAPRPLSRPDRAGPVPRPSGLRQWMTLTLRFLAILRSDPRTLGMVLAQPVFLGALTCLVFEERPIVLFLLIVSALWLGTSLAAQQIVKERAVYRRERMVNVRIGPYLMSKLVPLCALGAVQAGLLLGTVWLLQGREGNGGMQWAALTLASWNAVVMGLIVSVAAANPDRATAVVPALMLPQIVLGGVLLSLPAMGPFARGLADLAVARWANQAMEIALLEGRTVDQEMLARPPYNSALWDLYPEYDFRQEPDRQRFLLERAGKPVRMDGCLALDFAVLASLIVAQAGVLAVLLRRVPDQ